MCLSLPVVFKECSLNQIKQIYANPQFQPKKKHKKKLQLQIEIRDVLVSQTSKRDCSNKV